MSPEITLLQRVDDLILQPTIYLILTAGLLFFIYGLVEFLWGLKEGSNRQEGLNHMLWGIVGMFIMVSVYGIIALIINTIGADPANPDVSRLNSVQPASGFFTPFK